LPGFSCHICSYGQPNFPAVSVVICRDFLALPFLAPEGRDFPAVSVVFGRDFPAVAFLAWVIKKNSMGSRQSVLVSTAGFSVLSTEFSAGKLKQKGFFHSVLLVVLFNMCIYPLKPAHICPLCDSYFVNIFLILSHYTFMRCT
jgi:hypothetical protein